MSSEDQETPQDESKLAPDWLADMRFAGSGGTRASEPRGFYVNFELFAAVHVLRDTDVLMVGFDNLSSVNDKSLAREAWGDSFYRENNWSSLGIMSFKSNWYRDEVLFDYLEGLRDSGFFRRFKKVIFTGTSMGAYASCVFCSLAPGSTVLAYSPQSTLDTNLVPWEKRFHGGRKQDWSGRFSDAADYVHTAGEVFLFHDSMDSLDKKQADRLQGPNITRLNMNYIGHKTVVFLRRAEILKPIVLAAVAGNLTPRLFAQIYRKRRELPWFYYGLMEKCLEKGRFGLANRVIAGAKAAGRDKLSQSLEKKLSDVLGAPSSGTG